MHSGYGALALRPLVVFARFLASQPHSEFGAMRCAGGCVGVLGLAFPNSPIFGVPCARMWGGALSGGKNYFFSLCSVYLRRLGLYFINSNLACVLRLFLVVVT